MHTHYPGFSPSDNLKCSPNEWGRQCGTKDFIFLKNDFNSFDIWKIAIREG